jgi:hypothetical protein
VVARRPGVVTLPDFPAAGLHLEPFDGRSEDTTGDQYWQVSCRSHDP